MFIKLLNYLICMDNTRCDPFFSCERMVAQHNSFYRNRYQSYTQHLTNLNSPYFIIRQTSSIKNEYERFFSHDGIYKINRTLITNWFFKTKLLTLFRNDTLPTSVKLNILLLPALRQPKII